MVNGNLRFRLAELPEVLVVSVGELLPAPDLACLPIVCSCWAWALGRAFPGRTPPPARQSFPRIRPFPWLILPEKAGENADRLSLLRITDGRTRCLSPLPEIHGRRCVGSSQSGWLVTLNLTLEPRLLNPLTREEIPLPSLLTADNEVVATYAADGSISGFFYTRYHFDYSLEEFRDYYVRRILLTSAPPSCVAVAVLTVNGRDSLAFVRPGDNAWVALPVTSFKLLYCFLDVVYREEEEKLYSVNRLGDVLVFDLLNWGKKNRKGKREILPITPKCSLFSKRPPTLGQTDHRYIIFSSSGDLLQIGRDRFPVQSGRWFTKTIDILKLDRKSNSWVPCKDLGDESLFLGCNGSVSFSTSEMPQLLKNCVYFTEDFAQGADDRHRKQARDVGVYDLQSGTYRKIFRSTCKVNWPPPIWFMPPLPSNPWD